MTTTNQPNNKPGNALDRYQVAAGRTRNVDPDYRKELGNYGLGITGEAGEVADILKKHLHHGHELDADHLAKELGDVLWYVANLAAVAGFKLSDIATKNVKKLEARFPEGFNQEASKNRAEDDV